MVNEVEVRIGESIFLILRSVPKELMMLRGSGRGVHGLTLEAKYRVHVSGHFRTHKIHQKPMFERLVAAAWRSYSCANLACLSWKF